MPSINMIAARRAEKKRIEKLVYTTLMVIVGQLAITIGLMGFMTARVHAANSNIRRLDAEMAKITPTVQRIKRYESEIGELKPRLELLGRSREQTMLWYTVLQDFAQSMPEQTWLTAVATNAVVQPSSSDSSSGSQPAVTVNLSGTSASQKLVGEAMLRLNQCPEFERVDLNYTQQNAGALQDALQFQIAAKVKPSSPQKGGEPKNAKD